MKTARLSLHVFAPLLIVLSLTAISVKAGAQACQTSADLDDATRTAITNAAQRDFALIAKGDSVSLKQNATPSMAADFSSIEALVKDRQPVVSGAQPSIKKFFLLDNPGVAPNPHAEFYCGVFNRNGQTENSAVFYFDNLPPAKYAPVLIDATSAKGRSMVTEILQQVGTDWKLAGLYIKAADIGGHDSDWFLQQARQYKTKGETHNAWFFYEEARSLMSPVSFMSTLASDKLYDESQSLRPADLPAGGKTVDLNAGTATYKLTQVYPEAVGNDLDLIVKYQSADASNTNQAYSDNAAVIKAITMKYPELRDAFAGVVARAVDANGRDYGTLMAMKDIK